MFLEKGAVASLREELDRTEARRREAGGEAACGIAPPMIDRQG